MLNIQSISKTFNPGTVNAKQALSGLSLHLDHGDFVTIIGSNGAGKSTLFNAIAGSFYVDDGFIELDGEDITYMPEHKRSLMVGRLFQDPLKGTAPAASLWGEKSLHCAIAEESFVFRCSDGTTIGKRQIARMDIDHHFSYDSIRIILKNGKIKTAVAENKQIAVRENGAYKLYSLAKIDSVITGT